MIVVNDELSDFHFDFSNGFLVKEFQRRNGWNIFKGNPSLVILAFGAVFIIDYYRAGYFIFRQKKTGSKLI